MAFPGVSLGILCCLICLSIRQAVCSDRSSKTICCFVQAIEDWYKQVTLFL